MPNLRRIARNLARPDGSEIAEAAVVLPLAFMFMLGIIWFGRAFNIYSTIAQAAQQGAIAAAREACATCGANGDTPPSSASADGAIYAVMHASSLNVTQMQANNPPNCGTAPCAACATPSGGICSKITGANGGKFYVCQNVKLNPSAANPQCGTVVSFQFPFQFSIPFTSVNNVLMSAQAQSRMEN